MGAEVGTQAGERIAPATLHSRCEGAQNVFSRERLSEKGDDTQVRRAAGVVRV